MKLTLPNGLGTVVGETKEEIMIIAAQLLPDKQLVLMDPESFTPDPGTPAPRETLVLVIEK